MCLDRAQKNQSQLPPIQPLLRSPQLQSFQPLLRSPQLQPIQPLLRLRKIRQAQFQCLPNVQSEANKANGLVQAANKRLTALMFAMGILYQIVLTGKMRSKDQWQDQLPLVRQQQPFAPLGTKKG
jgi:hypothetical protein